MLILSPHVNLKSFDMRDYLLGRIVQYLELSCFKVIKTYLRHLKSRDIIEKDLYCSV